MSTKFHCTISAASQEQQTISAGKGDILRPAHVRAYHSLLSVEGTTLPAWLTMELAHKVCENGAGSLTQAQRNELNTLMERIPAEGHGSRVHIWAKGLCAFLILTSPFAPVS